MAGFPHRIARSSFGPTIVDKFPVVNPKHDIGEAAFNLLFWQTAGMNTSAARAMLQVHVDGGAGTAETVYQGFAWDPNGTLPKLAWNRSAAGVYTFSLPQSQYEDERGNPVTIDIVGGMAVPQGLVSGNVVLGQFEKTAARAGTVHMYVPQLNSKRDVDFLCFLW